MSGVITNGVFQTWDEYTASRKNKKRAKASIAQSDKLINRLNAELNMKMPLGVGIRQLNPTPKQLSCGGFKWTFEGTWSIFGSTLKTQLNESI